MVCESHHSNEDVPECTIRAAFDGLDDVLDVIAESCAEILDAGNRAELDQVQQDIICLLLCSFQFAQLIVHYSYRRLHDADGGN